MQHRHLQRSHSVQYVRMTITRTLKCYRYVFVLRYQPSVYRVLLVCDHLTGAMEASSRVIMLLFFTLTSKHQRAKQQES